MKYTPVWAWFTSLRMSCRTSRRSSTSYVRTSETSAPGRITGNAKKPSRYSARCCGDIPRRIVRGLWGSFCSKSNIYGQCTRKCALPVNHLLRDFCWCSFPIDKWKVLWITLTKSSTASYLEAKTCVVAKITSIFTIVLAFDTANRYNRSEKCV